MKKYILCGLILTGCATALAYNPVLKSVKSGDKVLVCNGNIVEPDLVEDFSDGTWFFINGYAKNCEVK